MHMKHLHIARKLLAFCAAAILPLFGPEAYAQVSVELTSENGRDIFEASVNGVTVKATYTDEPWCLSLSSTTYLFLTENGYIPDTDVRGMAVVKMPDGSSRKAGALVVRSLQVGNVVFRNVPANVINNQSVPLLVGSQAFQDAGEVIRKDGNLLIGDASSIARMQADPVDSLKQAAQDFLDAKSFSQACDALGRLYAADELNMFTHYQYCMALSLDGRHVENIAVSNDWVEKYSGKSLSMDYWIWDGLGNSQAETGDNKGAIVSLKKAFEADCSLYGTSERAIRKGELKNEDLGRTLYLLGQAYAREKNVSESERWLRLSAALGYGPAVDFCRKYRIKF